MSEAIRPNTNSQDVSLFFRLIFLIVIFLILTPISVVAFFLIRGLDRLLRREFVMIIILCISLLVLFLEIYYFNNWDIKEFLFDKYFGLIDSAGHRHRHGRGI